jgi:restriction system protein
LTLALTPIPAYHEIFNPLLNALRELGDSAALNELDEKTAKIMGVSEAALSEPHIRRRGTAQEIITASSEFSYRLRWALTYLKKAELITNSTRGIWSLTESGKQTPEVDPKAIIERARTLLEPGEDDGEIAPTDPGSASVAQSWSDDLLEILLELPPVAFERLAQRLLREAGFAEVQVTGRTGDGGIDGRGILRLNDLVSMSAVFQCKRYRSNVGAPEIREFRGALTGRADRGILVTTSGFTPAAIQEATRDGVTPIDLIDGERLVGLLKQFGLGVRVEMVESVSIEREWFRTL